MSIYINKIKRKTMKCDICYSDLLGDISEIKNEDERFEVLNEFCGLLQAIVKTETTIEMLRNWRKFFKKANENKKFWSVF